ncbi:serine hydrolase [Aquimarina sp. AD10]|uniref:serine hydrolase n=1 Tax=Aquimarina sp. AD10 TaxID=1714849 RepID=UPI000E5521AC|nr:serine hydrolase [Aquimarina sp. AD10]AXT59542.1 serine hydrolase [Aquimarina sp. AD10]RKM93441.1 serine hydrolase [Aquimarina sp. AD10]
MINKTRLFLLLFLILTNITFTQENSIKEFTSNREETSLVSPHIQVVPIKDTTTERNYELYIELPEDYSENNNKTYPVLYYTDAMWHLEMLSGATEYMLEDVILVGISWQKDINENLKKEIGAHVSRFRDYSFRKSNKPEIQKKYQLGQADKHLDFIRNDVIKYVENTYRTDPNSRTYFGYSMSGEFGAYILLTQPDTFNNYILGSPSIKNEVQYLTELNTKFGPYKASDKSSSLNANVFISYGSLEEEMEPIEEFVSLLKNRRDDGLSVLREVIDGTHQTAFPMTVVRSVAWLSSLMSHVSSNNNEISFWEIPQLNNAYISTTPEDKKDGIPIGKLGVDGGNKEMILKLSQEIADNKHDPFDSFLIAHKGKLIFESYYNKGRINLPHFQASATKAYTCLAIGRAIQLGYLSMEDLNKPLVSFLKDLDPTKFVKGVEKITLHQAMTMRSGIRISKKQSEEIEKNPNQLKGQGQVQAYLEHSAPITATSQSFKYQFDPVLAMQVLDAVVPGSAKDFIKNELLDKMGITNYDWKTDISGLPRSGSGTSMTSRNMVKWGILTANKGKYNGEQLVPEAFINKATYKILYTGDDDIYGGGKDVSNQGYGYYWWSADLKSGKKSYFSRSAQGGGGQYIILIEELDLVIVVTSHENDNSTLQIIAERILPAFIKNIK